MKKIKNSLIPLALALSLAGCVNLAPKYERPAAPVAGSFPTIGGTNASGNPVAAQAPTGIAWQQFFADARLKQLIDLALVNNRDLRISIANIEQARATYQIQRSQQFPTLSAAFNGSRVSATDTVVGLRARPVRPRAQPVAGGAGAVPRHRGSAQDCPDQPDLVGCQRLPAGACR
jgi:outer membrane protein TolC